MTPCATAVRVTAVQCLPPCMHARRQPPTRDACGTRCPRIEQRRKRGTRRQQYSGGGAGAGELRDAVTAYTRAVRDARAAKEKWLANAVDIIPVEKQRLCDMAKARRVQLLSTIDDVAEDFPEGPFSMAAHSDAAYAHENGIDLCAGDGVDSASDWDGDSDGSDADDGGDDGELCGDASDGGDGLAAALQDAATFADVPADDAEWELRSALAAPPVTEAQVNATPQQWNATVEAEEDEWEPEGGTARTVTVEGDVVEVELSHRAALGVLQARRRLQYELTLDPVTQRELIVRPEFMRVPKVNAEFEIDHMQLAHDSGERLLGTLTAVVEGHMPEIPARFRVCSPDVQDAMQAHGMCMVRGCTRHATKCADQSMHLCKLHRRSDCRVAGTDEVMRPCTACHSMWRVEEFREASGNDTTGGNCDVCNTKNRNRAAKSVAKARGEEPTLGPLPEHRAPSDAEVEGGLDADRRYLQDRWLCAQRLDRGGTGPGESLTNPYLVRGMYAKERREHPHQCVRVNCTGTIAAGRAGATLCPACFGVRSV